MDWNKLASSPIKDKKLMSLRWCHRIGKFNLLIQCLKNLKCLLRSIYSQQTQLRVYLQ